MNTFRTISSQLPRCLFTLLLLLNGWGALPSQDNYYFEVGLSGLPSEQRANLIQDSQGFIWFCYYGGIARYDGYEVRYFPSGEPNSVSGPGTVSMAEDGDGVIWILTKDNGLNSYDKESGRFRHYRHDPNDPGSISSDRNDSYCPQRLTVSGDGRILLGTFSGFNILDKETGRFLRFSHDPADPNTISHDNVTAVLQDRQGMIWVGTAGGGLNRYNEKTGVWTRFRSDPADEKSLSSDTVWSLLEDRNGVLWVGTWDGGLNRFDRESESFVHYRAEDRAGWLRDDKIFNLIEDSQGNIWICHLDSAVAGLERLNARRDRFYAYGHDPADSHSLSSNLITSVFEDPVSHILWVTNSLNGTIDKYDPRSRKFPRYRYNPADPDGLIGDTVLVFEEDGQGNIWISGMNGMNILDPDSGRFSHLMYDDVDPQLGNVVIAMAWEDDRHLWMLSNRGVLSLFDTAELVTVKRYMNIPGDPTSMMINTSTGGNLVQDRDDEDVLWISLTSGLERLNKRTGVFTHFVHDPADPQSISQGTVWSSWDDGRGGIWASTFGGLCRLDKKTLLFTRYVHDPDDPESIGFTKQSTVFEDSKGNFWVGGFTHGMDLMDRETETFRHFSKATGFPTSGVNQTIQEDDEGHLWIGTTDTGIIKFDIETKEVVTVYTSNDGVQDNHVWRSFKSRDGRMWFGGAFGVNAFHSREIRDNPLVPPVYLSGLSQGGVPVDLGKAPELLDEITLSWKENFFEFQFAALNYTKPEENRFAYMLEGRDKDWYYSGANPRGRYTGLEGGRYVLRMKASNNDGVWNETGRSLVINVIPPFWKTRLFRFLLILAIALTLLTVMWYLERLHFEIIQRKKSEMKLRQSEENLLITLNSIGDAVIATDTEGLVTRLNPVAESLTGWTAGEARGRMLKEVFHTIDAETRAPFESPVDQILSSGKADGLSRDTLLISRDGTEYHIADSGAPIASEAGEVYGMVLVFRNVSEEIALQEQLRQSQKLEAIGQLAGGVAHDFNNMLTGILGATNLLRENLPSGSQGPGKYIDMINDAAMRASDLTKKLLFFARKQSSSFKAIDLHRIIDDTVALMERTFDRRIEISIHQGALSSMINCDSSQIQNTLLNLGLNAAHAMEEGGRLYIETADVRVDSNHFIPGTAELEPGPYVSMTIRDEGSGMDPLTISRIFEPFFSTKEQGKGTGLGLSSVYSTVKQHKGSISVESSVGVGTTFTILLPVGENEPRDQERPQGQDMPENTGKGERILLIEDESIVRETMSTLLEIQGYNVSTAVNGLEGVQRFQADGADLVLVDMIMPLMSGSESFKRIREIDPDARIILLSGFSPEKDVKEMKRNGLNGFLMKPVDKNQLFKMMRRVLDG